MALTLKLRSGDLEPEPELQFDAPRVVVGRAHGSDLQLPDPSVSPRHASFRQRGSGYALVDEGSDNGTFNGNCRLARQAPYPLSDGDLVRFGRVWVEVRMSAGGISAEAGASRELARSLVEQALVGEGKPAGMSVVLETAEGVSTTLSVRRDRKAYIVGSQKSAHLRIEDPELPGRVLELRRQAGELWVTAHGAEPRVCLEGRELTPGERTLWPRGAKISIGERKLIHSDPTGEMLERLEQGPTERMDPSEVIEAPDGGAEEELDADADEATAADEPDLPTPSERPSQPGNAKGAMRTQPRQSRSGPGIWTRADALILLVAFSVLGLSLWAIRWIAGLGPA